MYFARKVSKLTFFVLFSSLFARGIGYLADYGNFCRVSTSRKLECASTQKIKNQGTRVRIAED